MRVALLCFVVAVACTGTVAVEPESEMNTAGLELRTDRSLYTIGETATLVLVNGLSGSVPSTNALCLPKVLRYSAGEWQSTGLRFDEACAMVGGQPPLPPGSSISRSFAISAAVFQPGAQYRMQVDLIEVETSRPVSAISNEFTVVDK